MSCAEGASWKNNFIFLLSLLSFLPFASEFLEEMEFPYPTGTTLCTGTLVILSTLNQRCKIESLIP